MAAALERLRRPEYTGENRCWPCTVTNVALLGTGIVVLLVLDFLAVAIAFAVIGAGAIVLRGYLVPYTPRLGPRLLEALPIEPIHRDRDGGSLAGTTLPDGDAVLATLLEAGVVVPEDEGEDLRLDASFHDDWRDEIERLRDASTAELARIGNAVTPTDVDVRSKERRGREYLVLDRRDGGVTTLHRAKAIAELGATRALANAVEDETVRLAAGRPLRPFLERCPDCGGELTVTTDDCCGPAVAPTTRPPEHLLCRECGARLFTYDRRESEADD